MGAKSYIIIICLLASLGIVWQFILPSYQNIQTESARIKQKKEEVAKLKEWVSRLHILEASYQAKEKEIAKLYKMLPDTKDVPSILNWLEILHFQTGMLLSSVNFTETTQRPDSRAVAASVEDYEDEFGATDSLAAAASVRVLDVDFGAVGTYDAFRNFIVGLENSLRLTDVQSIQFSFKGEEGELFDIGIKGKMYYR